MSDVLIGAGADSPSVGPAGLGAAIMMFCSALSMCRRAAADLRPSSAALPRSIHARPPWPRRTRHGRCGACALVMGLDPQSDNLMGRPLPFVNGRVLVRKM